MAYIDCDKCYHGRVCAHRHHYHDMIVECNHHTPTADVVEVKHGEWLDDFKTFVTVGGSGAEKSYLVGYKCSLCGRSEINKEPYCNCGAKMDGRKDT